MSGLEVRRDGPAAWLTLNRPEALNALDQATKDDLVAALREAADDRDVRAVALTGSGRAFCVGQDLKEHVEDLIFNRRPDALQRRHGGLGGSVGRFAVGHA